MSQMVRRQLIEISNTLRDANNLLEKLFQGVADEEMIGLLTECQNCAITMGNKIEAVYGSGLKSIHALENYCESIYQISQHLDSLPECMEIYDRTKEQLLEVQSGIEEIPDKKEIAFMPYKASMWDSLESVYLAAREDENCEAYVVPIPYFDRKADKTLGTMHYEGAEYPANIPITNWEKYNFEERLPDVIYIHNPYDDWNLVTCVHPRFFSSNLKKYTEELVYIPYFVLPEIEPEDQRTIDSMKHFIWTSGVINADKVIVQSEKMKQIYVNEYLKAAQANGLQGNHLDRKYLEEKFLGLGSPKIDKVLNTKQEDLEIPEEWLKIIQKPDGSRKKIIFYNTSIAALLENNEKMLEKMKDVFRIFKENKDEVALLWRPHPLIESTVSSMRPQLWVEYEKLVKWYKEESWGIYDDTSDMDRAVVLSDAYYGDQSSVVQVYQRTGKPVMIQNVIIKHQKNISIFGYTFSACNMKQDIVLSSYSQNELFLFDKQKECIYSRIKLGESQYGVTISEVTATEDVIITAPYYSYNFYLYHPKTKEIINKRLEKDDVRAAYKLCKYNNNEVWFLPAMKSKYMYSYNIMDDKLIKYPSVFEVYSFEKLTYEHTMISDLQIINNTIFFAERLGRRLFTYKINERKWLEYSVNGKIVDFVAASEDEVWCLNSDSELFLLNHEEKYSINISKIEDRGKLLFSHIELIDNHIWCMPDMSDSILVFDVNTKTFSNIKIYDNVKLNRLCNHYTLDQNYLYVFSFEIEEMWKVNTTTGSVEQNKLFLPSNDTYLCEQNVLHECELSIQFFLSDICKESK